MSNMTEKMQAYVRARIEGLNKRQAGLLAGYSAATVEQAVSRLETREDVRKAIAAGKRKAKKSTTAEAPERDNDDPDGPKLKDHYDTPLAFMLDMMNNPRFSAGLRFEAAKQAMPYVNPRMGEAGKKEKKQQRAEEIAGKGKEGKPRFAPKAPPGNVVSLRR